MSFLDYHMKVSVTATTLGADLHIQYTHTFA